MIANPEKMKGAPSGIIKNQEIGPLLKRKGSLNKGIKSHLVIQLK